MMNKVIKKAMAWGMLVLMCMAAVISQESIYKIEAESRFNKIFFIVKDIDEKEKILSICDDAYLKKWVDVSTIHEIEEYSISQYAVVASEYSLINETNCLVQIDFNKTTVYLYGGLTISEYKKVTGIQKFAKDVVINDINGNSVEIGKQFFDSAYEDTKVFDIISFGKKALLCQMDEDIKTLNGYFQNIYESSSSLLGPQTRATILESKFDLTVAVPGGTSAQTAVIYLDYTLYRNYDEQDSVYDYFGIITKVWITCYVPKRDDASLLKEKFSLPNKDDNLLETGPSSKKRESSFSVGIGFGDKLSGSLSYTVDLGARPDIERKEDFTKDTVEWFMTCGGVSSLHNIVFKNSATWASLQSKHLAEIDVAVGGRIQIMDGRFGHDKDYETFPIRFSYNG